METFKTTREIHEHLLAGGKVQNTDLPSVVISYNAYGFLNTYWQFDSPYMWVKYIEPKVPVKYSVDIWFNDTPKPSQESIASHEYLFGVGWNRTPKAGFNKYRITVEEVSNED